MKIDFGPQTVETRVAPGPIHHFFGYYGTCPWNASGTHHLALRSTFDNHLPREGETAALVAIDQGGKLHYVTRTAAWNFQQGALQAWLPSDPDRRIVLNDIIGGQVRGKIVDASAALEGRYGEEELPLVRPVSAISPAGDVAASFDYNRTGHFRPVCRYPLPAKLPWASTGEAPRDDGIWTFNMLTGKETLAASLHDINELSGNVEKAHNRPLWVNHTVFSRDGKRLLFLARYRKKRFLRGWSPFDTAMFTVGAGGSHLRKVIDWGHKVSHFWWTVDGRILSTFKLHDGGKEHVIFPDADQPEYTLLSADLPDRDGHPSDSPDGQWIVTDTYTTRRKTRRLIVVRATDGGVFNVGEYGDRWTPSGFNNCRCDLHPRWARDGTKISFDSVMSGTRQVYVIDVTFT